MKVRAKELQTEETIEIVGDVLVTADGCLSSIRQSFLPDLNLMLAHQNLKKKEKEKFFFSFEKKIVGYAFVLRKILL